MYGFIYITTNTKNGKRYLGMCGYHRSNYTTYLGSGKALKRALRKYGKENFTRIIIAEAETKKELSEKEIELIKIYNCVEYENWYNINSGGYATRGFSGKKHSEETKIKMRNNYKRILTEKGRSNISKAAKLNCSILGNTIVSCPNCKKLGKKGPMHRWHFDNCRESFNQEEN